MTGLRSRLDVVATVLMIVVSMLLIVLIARSFLAPRASAQGPARAEIPIPKEPVSFRGAARMGSPTAPVVMVLYSEFQCPYCRAFAKDTFPKVAEEYIRTGKVELAFKHLPLPIHQFAFRAAEAAECARRQGEFWPMHDALFLNAPQAAFDDLGLTSRASQIKLDVTGFQRCLTGQANDAVRADAASAKVLGITGTPTFLVGRRDGPDVLKVASILRGAQGLDRFDVVLQGLLRK